MFNGGGGPVRAAQSRVIRIGIFDIPVFARITRRGQRGVGTRLHQRGTRRGQGAAGHHARPRAAQTSPASSSRTPPSASPPPSWPRLRLATWAWARSRRSHSRVGAACLNETQSLMFQAPLLAVYPGVAIVLSVLGLAPRTPKPAGRAAGARRSARRLQPRRRLQRRRRAAIRPH